MTLFDYIKNGYTKLVVPSAMVGVPIEMPKLLKEDGSYYSINDLHTEFGAFYTPIKVTPDHIMVRWAFDDDGIEKADFLAYMGAKGMVNHRPAGVKADAIDWGALPPNGFVILAEHELEFVPICKEPVDIGAE